MAPALLTFLSEEKRKELAEKGPECLNDLIRTVMGWEETDLAASLHITRAEFIDAVITLIWLGLKQEERDEQENQSLPN